MPLDGPDQLLTSTDTVHRFAACLKPSEWIRPTVWLRPVAHFHAVQRYSVPIEIVWESMGYHKRYSGIVTGAEIADSVRAQSIDTRFDHVRYAINEYEPGLIVDIDPSQIAELEMLEKSAGYPSRGILITYVTQDPALIRFLSSVYLQSLMVIYPMVAAARSCILKMLSQGQPPDREGRIDTALYFGVDGPTARSICH